MHNMFNERKSRYNFEETVLKLSDIIAENGWKVTFTHDLQATMEKNGFTVSGAKVLEMCNPKLAYQILSKDDLRIYSSMMPCRISVYEKQDGNTYISQMNVGAFAAQIGGEVEKVMTAAFEQSESFIAKLI